MMVVNSSIGETTESGPTIEALRINPDGQCALIDIPASSEPDALRVRQEAVGGFIENIYFGRPGTDDADAMLWINEDGKMTYGGDGYNGLATDLVRHRLFFGDYITGPVLVVGSGTDGNDGDVPDWVTRTVKRFPDARFEQEGMGL